MDVLVERVPAQVMDDLTTDDAAAAAALSALFGWPHRQQDWAFFLRIGHGVAWREEGALAGTAMWFPLGDAQASIGLVQVAPQLQGKGIGRKLMRAVMDAAGARKLMLHATREGAALYESLGFASAGTIRQFQGESAATPSPLPVRIGTGDESFAAIARLDRAATGLARAAVLRACLDGASPAMTGSAADPTGYALRRRFGRGMLIGPVVAEDEQTAIALAASLVQPGFVRMDVACAPGALTDWVAAIGLACVGEVRTMTRGDWPSPAGPARRFALASQALG